VLALPSDAARAMDAERHFDIWRICLF